MDAGRSKAIRKGGAACFLLPPLQREANGAICILQLSTNQEINMSDSEIQHPSSNPPQKARPEAQAKDPTRQLPDADAGNAAEPSSVKADDGDDTIEAELEGKNSSNGNEVA
jgi:hypothetical protein